MTTRAVTLNGQQQRFAELYAMDPEVQGHGTNSAIRAGYAADCAAQTASRLLRHPGVRAEIERLNRELIGDFATAAIRYLGRLVKDEAAHPKLRLEAAKTLLDRGGYVPPRSPLAPEVGEKELQSMSLAELQAFVIEGKARIEMERRLITNMVDVTPAAAENQL